MVIFSKLFVERSTKGFSTKSRRPEKKNFFDEKLFVERSTKSLEKIIMRRVYADFLEKLHVRHFGQK